MDALQHSYGGFGLSLSEQQAVRIALNKLVVDEKTKNSSFWGKIFGTERDYVIASTTQSSFGQIRKQFFVYNNQTCSFDKLLPPTEKATRIAASLRTAFQGDITNIFKSKEEKKSEEEAAEESISELERLSYVVYSIDDDCAVVPSNAVLLTASKEILPNYEYRGLDVGAASLLESYRHYRDSKSQLTRERVQNTLYHFKGEFLDTVGQNHVTGAWNVNVDESQRFANVRSALWPGYQFYASLDNCTHFGGYFGNGIKQEDLAFII